VLRISLATEDELSEVIGQRLLNELPGKPGIGLLLRKGGNGYLRSRIRNFCELARRQPLLLITDLDSWACPSKLRSEWLGSVAQPDKLAIRVAVREIEAWLLADHEAMEELLGKRVVSKLPVQADKVQDPNTTAPER
jgi:hypothetical protein